MKKKNSKKQVRYPTKRGINLASTEERRNKTFTVVFLFIAIVALAAAVAKFGVIDLFEKRSIAEKEYNSVHTQYMATTKSIEEYDNVLLEYRTYSMDWMENDESGRYVSVARRDILDMIEREMRTNGEVESVKISGNRITVDMNGMNLSEISDMCTDIEEYPFVKSAFVQTAKTEQQKEKPVVESDNGNGAIITTVAPERDNTLEFQVIIQIQRVEKKEG